WQRICEFAMHLSKSDVNLQKAVEAKDWNRIKDSHNDDNMNMVDHTHHTDVAKVPEKYSKMISSPKKFKDIWHGNGPGVSAKMVNKVDKDTFMTKAYHKRVEEGRETVVPHPIMGWSSIATRALYDAGNIGHLCE